MLITHDVLSFDTNKNYFEFNVDEKLLVKYLKGVYRNDKPRFINRFVNYFKAQFIAHKIEYCNYMIDNLVMLWDDFNSFTYKEAFELSDRNFKSKVFSSIDIREMIDNLGVTRINTEGKELINKVWNEQKGEFELVPYHVIYELHHVCGEKLGLEDKSLPVVKCWCTTTNEEHWLWVDNNNFDGKSPLDAIASTCIIYESMKNHIKHIIRQGDVFLFEMTEDIVPKENEKLIRLSKEKYFDLLKSQA